MTSNIEVADRAITCLLREIGAFETEQFISYIIREKFDYTKWQRDHYDNIPAEEFFNAAVAYEEEHPFTPKKKGTTSV